MSLSKHRSHNHAIVQMVQAHAHAHAHAHVHQVLPNESTGSNPAWANFFLIFFFPLKLDHYNNL